MTSDYSLSTLALWAINAVCEVCWEIGPENVDLELVETGPTDSTIMCLTCLQDYIDECKLKG